jgi:pimeloyl-ACP methyl ester carboxylesterase
MRAVGNSKRGVFDPATRLLHWLTAGLMLCAFVLAFSIDLTTSRASHTVFLLLMTQPILGILQTNAHGDHVNFFLIGQLPALIERNRLLSQQRTSVRIAEELRSALQRAGIEGPYILVGHAFGGDNIRTFADLHMGEVAGMVLVDADATDLEPKWMQELDRRGRADLVSQLHDCRDAIAEHKPLPAFGSGPGNSQKTCAQQLFFRGLPEIEWSPELNASLLEIAQTKVAMYDAYASEMEQMAQDEAYLQQHRRSLGSRPIRVLTGGNHGVPAEAPDRANYELEITHAQARWLAVSSNSKQIFAHSNSEYIQFDDRETVITAIREVYDHSKKLPERQ